MDESELRSAVRAAKAGDKAVLAGFGLERVAAAGERDRDAFTVDGACDSVVTTLRSPEGQPSGEFRRRVSGNELTGLLEAIERTDFDALRTAAVPPYGMRIELSIVAGGVQGRWTMPAGEHAPLSALLAEIDRLAGHAAASPVAGVAMELALEPVSASSTEARGRMRLRNPGSEGLWLVHPAFLWPRDETPYDQLLFEYGRIVPVAPDANPPPMIFARAEPSIVRPAQRLAWLGPGAALEIDVAAPVTLRPARYAFRATYSSYGTADRAAGRRVFRGQARALDVVVEVV